MNQRQKNENPVRFNGSGSEFFSIWIVNILLTVLTLGIYSAWAKVRTKKYFYGNTELADHSFDYHARPMQILKGRIIASICFIIWVVSSNTSPIISSVLLLAFYLILPFLIRGNARFDAAMTSYRNVRFSFTGSVKDAYIAFVGKPLIGFSILVAGITAISLAEVSELVIAGSALVLAIAFLLLTSWIFSGIARYFANHYQYGGYQFSADIRATRYVRIYLMASLFFVLILGLFFVLFDQLVGGVQLMSDGVEILQAAEHNSFLIIATIFLGYLGFFVATMLASALIRVQVRNYIFSQIVINEAEASAEEEDEDEEHNQYRLKSEMSIPGYLWLVFSNFILQAVSVGLARPWVKVRTQRYLAGVTSVLGDMEALLTIDQTEEEKSAIADEMAETFDLDLGIG